MKSPLAPDRAPPRGLRASIAEALAIGATLALCAAVGGLWATIERIMP